MPQAICELAPIAINRNLIVNRHVPPFDNPDLRQDRKSFIDIITQGQGDIGGVIQPLPERLWGMPPEVLKALPGYDPDLQKNRAEARKIMNKVGYRPGNRLKVKLTARDLPYLQDHAMILVDQLKEVYIDGDLETIDTTNYLPKGLRRDYVVGLSRAGSGPDPYQILYLNYGRGGKLNYNGHCNAQVDALIDSQSIEADQAKCKRLIWEIERKLAEDGTRSIIFYDHRAICGQTQVKGLTIMVDSIFNGDVWLDQ